MRRCPLFGLVSALLAGLVFAGASPASGVTKVAPTRGDPDHPFTLIDSGGGLADWSVAVFRLNGSEVVVPLDTHQPYRTAQGRVPSNIAGGTYTVAIRRPDGTEIAAGAFTVVGAPLATPPSISPTSAPATGSFTITDPQGRMAGAQFIVFFSEGQSPSQGTIVADAAFSPDGTTATGTVPLTLLPQLYFVTVHIESTNDPPVFNALEFLVTP